MKFVGREKEQKAIGGILDKDGYQACILYGRRRMGKTELIKHCLMNKGVPCIIYQCKESNEIDNAHLLGEVIQKELGAPYLRFERFMDAVSFLFEYAREKELYFVIDEYPYIRESIKGCDSKLQAVIDKYAMITKIKFFLLGSSVSIMSSLQEKDNPLYMRFSSSILLRQMDYYDAAKFYPSLPSEDKVKLYAVFGGVPFYNAQIRETLSVKDNIINILSGRFSGLRDFLDVYLRSELRKINGANIVFENIALGAFHFSDILSKTHLDSSAALSAILSKLLEMDLIEYVCPINDKNNKQKAGYRISDQCVRFYYSFIYRNESSHKILDDDVFYDVFIDEELDKRVVPLAFEKIAKEFLIRKNNKKDITPFLLDIGTYWYDDPREKKNGQFDVVGKAKDGYVFFECKYSEKPIADDVIKEEVLQISQTTLKPCQYGFFSRSGFQLKQTYSYLLFTLKDLYADGL